MEHRCRPSASNAPLLPSGRARDIGVILGFTIFALIGGALTLRRRTP